MIGKNNHRPLHIYSGCVYFLTGRTYNKKKYFRKEGRKKIFLKILKQASERFNTKLYAWVVLDNHYHLLFRVPSRHDEMSETNFVTPLQTDFADAQSVNPYESGYFLIEFVRKLHKDTARLINQQDRTPGRQVWYQYWDRCIRNEKDFFIRFNYILKNPLKHRLVEDLEKSFQYKYSSNPIWLKKRGLENLYEVLRLYPVKSELFTEDW